MEHDGALARLEVGTMDSTTFMDELLGWLEPLGAGLAVVAALVVPQALDLWCPALLDALGLLVGATFVGGIAWLLTTR